MMKKKRNALKRLEMKNIRSGPVQNAKKRSLIKSIPGPCISFRSGDSPRQDILL
jgi:hypothetical protein